MNIELAVTLRLDKFGHKNVTRVFPISLNAYRDVASSIDEPCYGADALSSMLCTPPEVIEATKANRREFIEMVASSVATIMTEALEASDTKMGYPKGDQYGT